MDFDLTELAEWARRTASDRPASFNELLTGNGGVSYTINNDGDIALTSVTIDNDPVDIDTITVSGSQITFDTPASDGANIEVNYTRQQYSEEELLDVICDAAREVGVDLEINWLVNVAGRRITNINEAEFIAPDGSTTLTLNPLITRLIVLKVDLVISTDKSNRATDDAILIKDGDTTIDTSRGAGAQSGSLTRKYDAYQKVLTNAKSRRFKGGAMRED